MHDRRLRCRKGLRHCGGCLVFAFGLTSACDPADDDPATPACESESAATAGAGDEESGPGAVMQIAVDCSFVYAGMQTDVTFDLGQQLEVPVGGPLLARGYLDGDEYEGRSFSLGIYAEDGSGGASALYQMDPSQLPANEFWGDHGFTGLNRVDAPGTQEGVQYACFARDPSEPPHAWEN